MTPRLALVAPPKPLSRPSGRRHLGTPEEGRDKRRRKAVPLWGLSQTRAELRKEEALASIPHAPPGYASVPLRPPTGGAALLKGGLGRGGPEEEHPCLVGDWSITESWEEKAETGRPVTQPDVSCSSPPCHPFWNPRKPRQGESPKLIVLHGKSGTKCRGPH